MHNREAIEMMTRSAQALRRKQEQIDRLAPKAEAYAMICTILNLIGPQIPMGGEEDVARMLEHRIKELEKEEAEAQPAAPAKPFTSLSRGEQMAALTAKAAEAEKSAAAANALANARGDKLVEVDPSVRVRSDEMVNERMAVERGGIL